MSNLVNYMIIKRVKNCRPMIYPDCFSFRSLEMCFEGNVSPRYRLYFMYMIIGAANNSSGICFTAEVTVQGRSSGEL